MSHSALGGVCVNACPFCGQEADLRGNGLGPGVPYVVWIECTKCQATGPRVYTEDDYEAAVRKAVHRWNIRSVRL